MIKVAAPNMASRSSTGPCSLRRRRSLRRFPLAASYAQARTLRLRRRPYGSIANAIAKRSWGAT